MTGLSLVRSSAPPAPIPLPVRARRLGPDARHRVERILHRLEQLGAVESVRAIARCYGCRDLEVLGGDRHKYPTRARRRIWMVLQHTLDLGQSEIARLFEMDHSSIATGIRLAEQALELEHRERSRS